MRVLMEAYERSGSRLARKVIAGEITEADARGPMAMPNVPECESSSANPGSPFGV